MLGRLIHDKTQHEDTLEMIIQLYFGHIRAKIDGQQSAQLQLERFLEVKTFPVHNNNNNNLANQPLSPWLFALSTLALSMGLFLTSVKTIF